jgi:1-acyl-sn-glycerol-3-phosphate acyltransferase
MVLLSTLVFVHENRAFIPAICLASQWIPVASLAIANKGLSFVIPHKTYCYLDNLLYKTFLRSCLFIFENCNGARINLYGDIPELREKSDSSLVICNHQSDVDWSLLNSLAARHSHEGQQSGLRFVLKTIIQYGEFL